MIKLEILWELPKCDTETQNEQMLIEQWPWQICLTQGCRRSSIYFIKNTISEKCNNAKLSKPRYTYIWHMYDMYIYDTFKSSHYDPISHYYSVKLQI